MSKRTRQAKRLERRRAGAQQKQNQNSQHSDLQSQDEEHF